MTTTTSLSQPVIHLCSHTDIEPGPVRCSLFLPLLFLHYTPVSHGNDYDTSMLDVTYCEAKRQSDCDADKETRSHSVSYARGKPAYEDTNFNRRTCCF